MNLGLRDDVQTDTLSRGELFPKGAALQMPEDVLMSLMESHATYKVPANWPVESATAFDLHLNVIDG